MADGPLKLRSRREIRLMRPAGLLVWRAHQLISELVRPGVTTREIDAAVEKLFQDHDAIALFQAVPGQIPFPSVTCMSLNEAEIGRASIRARV